MNTPNLDALLKEVEAVSADPYGVFVGKSANPLVAGILAGAAIAPRLAAMLRVAVDALNAMGGENHTVTGAALARIETLAGGDA